MLRNRLTKSYSVFVLEIFKQSIIKEDKNAQSIHGGAIGKGTQGRTVSTVLKSTQAQDARQGTAVVGVLEKSVDFYMG